MRRFKRALPPVALITAVLLAGIARADTIWLADGREIEGTVTEDGDKTVKIRVTRGTGTAVMEVPRADVLHIRKKGIDTAKLGKDAERALALGQREDAIRILRSLVDARPEDARARRDLAFAELLDEQLERARDDYSRAIALDGADVESLVGLGYACTRLGERDAAIKAYRKATVIAPRHVRPWLALAELLLARGERGDREDAITSAKHALDAQPRSADAVLLAAEGHARAQGLGASDEHKKALALLEAFLKDHATADGVTRVARRAADLAFGAGDAARSKQLLTTAIATAPPVSSDERERLLALEALYGWLAAGRSEPALGLDAAGERLDADAALRRVDLALEAVPAEGDLLVLRARLLSRRGRSTEAAESAASAEAALPAGAAKEDAALLHEVLALKPDATAKKDERRPLAEKRARRLVVLLPWSADAHEWLARSLEATNDFAGARDAAKKAATLASDAAEKKRLGDEADRLDGLRAKREKNKDL